MCTYRCSLSRPWCARETTHLVVQSRSNLLPEQRQTARVRSQPKQSRNQTEKGKPKPRWVLFLFNTCIKRRGHLMGWPAKARLSDQAEHPPPASSATTAGPSLLRPLSWSEPASQEHTVTMTARIEEATLSPLRRFPLRSTPLQHATLSEMQRLVGSGAEHRRHGRPDQKIARPPMSCLVERYPFRREEREPSPQRPARQSRIVWPCIFPLSSNISPKVIRSTFPNPPSTGGSLVH